MPDQTPDQPPQPPDLPEMRIIPASSQPSEPPEPDRDYPAPPPTEITAVPTSQVQSTAGRRSGCMWGMLGCLALAVIPVVVALVMGLTTVNGLVGGIQNIFSPAPPVARITTTQTIINSVQPLGQLVSISAQLAKAEIGVSIAQGTLNSCNFSATHVAQGTIEAGVDLTRVSDEAIEYDPSTDTYTIALPSPQLTSCRIDFIRQYNRSFTACSVDWDEARVLANYIALNDFRDDAIEGGILNRAQQEVRVIVTNFVQALTGDNVEVVFPEELQDIPYPSSCMPEVPAGWTQNEQTGEWVKR